jgi:hypothetical protein
MYCLAGGASPDQFPETSLVAEFLVGIGHGYDFPQLRNPAICSGVELQTLLGLFKFR